MPVVFLRTLTLDSHIIEVLHFIRLQNPQVQRVQRVSHLMTYQAMVVRVLYTLLTDAQFLETHDENRTL